MTCYPDLPAGLIFTEQEKKIIGFPVYPLTTELHATLTIVESATVDYSSPIPRWYYWFPSQFLYMKNAARVREEWTRREIDKAVKAISRNAPENAWATGRHSSL